MIYTHEVLLVPTATTWTRMLSTSTTNNQHTSDQTTKQPNNQTTNTPTHQHTNTPTHQHTNTPTHQHTNTPTHQHTNTPTHQQPTTNNQQPITTNLSHKPQLLVKFLSAQLKDLVTFKPKTVPHRQQLVLLHALHERLEVRLPLAVGLGVAVRASHELESVPGPASRTSLCFFGYRPAGGCCSQWER
jgi:hypothetical protein